MADDLVAFLRARLDEDEQAAASAEDPALALAEVTANRGTVDDYADALGKDPTDEDERAVVACAEHALRRLATGYADHVDYREVWHPRDRAAVTPESHAE